MWTVSAVLTLSVVLWMVTTWWIGLLFGVVLSIAVSALVRHRRT